MNLTLTRTELRSDGIFGILKDESGNFVARTLEHAYTDGNGGWAPKIPTGTFKCVRGSHRLHGMTQDFTTFEITGVAGHDNLLFHWGNYDRDSEGCVLVGSSMVGNMITNSRVTFAKLMELQKDVDEFQLTVN